MVEEVVIFEPLGSFEVVEGGDLADVVDHGLVGVGLATGISHRI